MATQKDPRPASGRRQAKRRRRAASAPPRRRSVPSAARSAGVVPCAGAVHRVQLLPAGRLAARPPAALCRGLVGYGYYTVAPVLLLVSYILLFHRGRNVTACVVGRGCCRCCSARCSTSYCARRTTTAWTALQSSSGRAAFRWNPAASSPRRLPSCSSSW